MFVDLYLTCVRFKFSAKVFRLGRLPDGAGEGREDRTVEIDEAVDSPDPPRTHGKHDPYPRVCPPPQVFPHPEQASGRRPVLNPIRRSKSCRSSPMACNVFLRVTSYRTGISRRRRPCVNILCMRRSVCEYLSDFPSWDLTVVFGRTC